MGTGISYDQLNQATECPHELNERFFFDVAIPPIKQQRSTTDLNGKFVHSQILIDRLCQVPSTLNSTNELVTLLRAKLLGRLTEKNIIALNKFAQDYSENQALHYVTAEEPQLSLYLNKALREQDIDLLFKFRFLINDLRKQLQIHACHEAVLVYRSQRMSNDELKKLKKLKGKLISVNSFFATSRNRCLTVSRLGLSQTMNDGSERVLFCINLDPSVVTKNPFADLSSLSCFPSEQEILIMLGSIFRLRDIRPGEDDEKNAWIIEMDLCGDDDNDLKDVIDDIRTNNGNGDSESSLLLFAHALRDMGKFKHAQNYYQLLLENLSEDNYILRSRCYHGLGNVKDDIGDYKSSLELFEKALKILMQVPNPPPFNLIRIHISTGATQANTNCLTEALVSYENALLLLESQPVEADKYYLMIMCNINKAQIFSTQKKHPEAYQWFKKAHDLCQKHLSKNHELIGTCFIGFGGVDLDLGNLHEALKHYNNALKIYLKPLPHDHSNIGHVLENIGETYEMMGDMDQSLLYYKRSGAIFRKTLLPTHPEVVQNDQNIRRISSRRKWYYHIIQCYPGYPIF
jgi:tetratricopeptide (TPR) repeat protein